MTSPYDDIIAATAGMYGLDVDLLQAQVSVESSFNPDAFRYEHDFFERYIKGKDAMGSKYGPLAACSFGLLQVLLETALEQGYTDRPEVLFVPRIGLSWGAKYLKSCLLRTGGNYHMALARYNGTGIAAVAYANKVYEVAGRTI